MKKPNNFTDTEFELYQLMLIHSILDDMPVKELSDRVTEHLKIATLKDNPKGQRQAIKFFTEKLEQKGKCFDDIETGQGCLF